MPTLDTLGWCEFFDRQLTDEEREQFKAGRVVWAAREHYRVSTGEGEWRARLAGRLRHSVRSAVGWAVVGDWVLVAPPLSEGAATIHRCLMRKTALTRAATGRAIEAQVVAANVDTAFVMTSLNDDFNLRRLERYLTLTWESGARPVIVLNKADLCADHDTWRGAVTSIAAGVPVFTVSALFGDGMSAVREAIGSGGTTVLLGSSGVGKSTLLNAIIGEPRQAVLPVRDADDRGRHSTTVRQLFCAPGGGVVIDTPGLREVTWWGIDTGLAHAFADIDRMSEECRFRDCAHRGEPGCAISVAIENGELPPERLEQYLRLRREDEYMRSRYDEGARAARTRQAKRIAKAVRLQYKLRGR